MFDYIIIFIGGGFCGWVIDTAFRTACAKRYAAGTWLPYFSVIYGVAAVLLYILFSFISTSVFWDIILGSIVAVCLELVSGILILKILKRRLWNYDSSRYNFYGFIDAEHSFYWFVLVVVCRIFYGFTK